MQHKQLVDRTAESFRAHWQSEPECVGVAPGRVELLGNHTDYNDGLVLLVALDRAVAVLLRRRPDRLVRAFSTTLDAECTFDLDALAPDESCRWADYIKGVLDQLQKAGFQGCGADLVVNADLPIGLGVSSSAALEVSVLSAFSALWGFDLPPRERACLARRAENEFVGVNCGILDQFSAVFGDSQGALLLDCRSLEAGLVSIPGDEIAVVVADTGVRHELVAGHYNQRRNECMAGVEFFRQHRPEVAALRDVTPLEIDLHCLELDPIVLRRVRHVVEENRRVQAGAAALQSGNLEGLWHAMRASHNSSRDLFENSCPELDLLIDLAYDHQGLIGAKLSGGGFGGGTVNLVQAGAVDDFIGWMTRQYRDCTGVELNLLVCGIGQGAWQACL